MILYDFLGGLSRHDHNILWFGASFSDGVDTGTFNVGITSVLRRYHVGADQGETGLLEGGLGQLKM
ncbi:MAG: hypothetical protein AAFN80_07880 [Pseudomonadota bacterium]